MIRQEYNLLTNLYKKQTKENNGNCATFETIIICLKQNTQLTL